VPQIRTGRRTLVLTARFAASLRLCIPRRESSLPDSHATTTAPTPRLLSPTLALTPVLFLVLSLAGSVYLFGADSSYGANQIALILAAMVAGLVGLRLGHPWETVQDGLVKGISVGLGPTLILLSVGMLIGTWILAGTVPALIYYGVQLLSPQVFYAASAAVCAIVAVSIGSSWTVAGTLGIGLMGIAASFDLSPAITAGAIVSGAYFGDKLSPMSDTTNLASAATGTDLFAHIRHMLWTTVPGFSLALILFALLGSGGGRAPDEILVLQEQIADQFAIGPHLLIPLVFMLFLAWRRFPAYPSIIMSSLLGAVFALLFQAEAVTRLADSADLSTAGQLVKGVWMSLFDGYVSSSGNTDLDQLLSKGGMSSMLNTVWLIICALGFGGVMERLGLLRYLVGMILHRVKSTGSLIAATVGTCIGANIIAADQFISVAIPGRMYREEYERRGLSRLNLSRTLEDSATLTSALIPWNTCGAYMAGTLGVATFSYAPYAFFNIACPILAIAYGYLGFAQKPLEQESSNADPAPASA
jgi:NhaC family Na+:H+ antiporter